MIERSAQHQNFKSDFSFVLQQKKTFFVKKSCFFQQCIEVCVFWAQNYIKKHSKFYENRCKKAMKFNMPKTHKKISIFLRKLTPKWSPKELHKLKLSIFHGRWNGLGWTCWFSLCFSRVRLEINPHFPANCVESESLRDSHQFVGLQELSSGSSWWRQNGIGPSRTELRFFTPRARMMVVWTNSLKLEARSPLHLSPKSIW